jgi:hypothetical protein
MSASEHVGMLDRTQQIFLCLTQPVLARRFKLSEIVIGKATPYGTVKG